MNGSNVGNLDAAATGDEKPDGCCDRRQVADAEREDGEDNDHETGVHLSASRDS